MDIATILLTFLASSVGSFGLTAACKPILKHFYNDKWWFNPAIRFIAVVIGMWLGWLITHFTVEGIVIGIASGVLSAWGTRQFKLFIKSRLSQ